MDYALLGKLLSDKIECRFGYLRKLAGGRFWASARQFLEGEAIIRVKSLVCVGLAHRDCFCFFFVGWLLTDAIYHYVGKKGVGFTTSCKNSSFRV